MMYSRLKKVVALLCAFLFMITNISALADGLPSAAIQAISLSKAKITLLRSSGVYTGYKHHIPVKVTLVKDGQTITLTEGVDYVVAGNETSAATAKTYKPTIRVIGIGAYKGYAYKKFTYKITKASQTCNVELEEHDEATIDTSTMTFTVKYADVKAHNIYLKVHVNVSGTSSIKVSSNNSKVKGYSSGTIKLYKGLKAGTYKVTFYGKSNTNYNNSNKIIVYIKVVK